MQSSPQTPVILQVLPRLESGGVERGTIEITEAIARAGMRPLVASAGGAMVPQVARAGGEHMMMTLERKNPLVIRANAWRLYRLIKAHHVSIIHARSRAPGWAAYYAAKWAGIPFVTTFHGIYGTESKLKKTYNSVMVKGARVIAVSEFVRHHIEQTYDVDPARIRTIPRGVDFNQFDAARVMPARIQELTRQWRLYDQFSPLIFCPGRISRIKGQHVLIEALSTLGDTPFLCIIAGNAVGHEDYRDELIALIQARGLDGRVRLMPPTQCMAEAYTLSQLVVVPSIQAESFGRVAIEAQAMGRLIIATDHGGARETILPNQTGYLVPPNDPAMLAEAIRFALGRDPRSVTAMAEDARTHVRTHFTSERMQAATIDVYRELLP
jgi:glycosyltransferase involved in cell wall biosynthesis